MLNSETFKELFKRVSKINVYDMIPTRLHDDKQIMENIPILNSFIQLYRDIENLNFKDTYIIEDEMEKILSAGKAFVNIAENLTNMETSGHYNSYSLSQLEDAFLSKIRDINVIINNCIMEWKIVLPYLHSKSINIDKISSFLNDRFNNIQKDINEMITQNKQDTIEQYNELDAWMKKNVIVAADEINSLVKKGEEQSNRINKMEEQLKSSIEMNKKLQEISESIIIGKNAEVFKTEFKSHEKEALHWMKGIKYVLVVFLLFGLSMIVSVGLGFSEGKEIQLLLASITVISVLYGILSWCTSNYNAHKHNVIVNKHRDNALQTFESFMKSADKDQDAKNAILLQAAQCIFMEQPSGYISKQGEVQTDKILKIFQITK